MVQLEVHAKVWSLRVWIRPIFQCSIWYLCTHPSIALYLEVVAKFWNLRVSLNAIYQTTKYIYSNILYIYARIHHPLHLEVVAKFWFLRVSMQTSFWCSMWLFYKIYVFINPSIWNRYIWKSSRNFWCSEFQCNLSVYLLMLFAYQVCSVIYLCIDLFNRCISKCSRNFGG